MAGASDSASARSAQRENPQQTITSTTARRRNLLGALTAAGAICAAPAVAAAEDPHLAWERELEALRAHMKAVSKTADDETFNDLVDEEWEAIDQICSTPAGTPAGIAVQIRAVVDAIGERDIPNASERDGLRNALRSLELLAGRA